MTVIICVLAYAAAGGVFLGITQTREEMAKAGSIGLLAVVAAWPLIFAIALGVYLGRGFK